MTIEAAADGSALGNPGPAGWAWYVDESRWASGGWPRGTNNMGELMAVLDLLRQTAHVDDDLVVYCDSLYVINTVTQWMAGWKRKGWRKKDGKPVLNLDLVQALDEAMRTPPGRRVRFEWVKGHAGHPLNEEADRRAVAASTAFRDRRPPESGPGFPGAGPSGPVAAAEEDGDLFSASGTGNGAGVAVAAPDPGIDAVVHLERVLLSDAVRSDPEAVAALLDPAWTELGASGRRWTRAEMLASLPDAAPLGDAELEVLSVEELAPDVVLLVWRSRTEAGSALRSSVWVRSGGRWRQRFHQGTPEGVRRAR